MRVEQLGEGEPELAVVGSVHGDEPCGAHAIETLLEEAPDVTQPVKFIIANERALDSGVRFIDTDMNRAFPGDPDSDMHEQRLAAELLDELRGCTTFSMHSTQSYERAFAIVDETGPFAASICPALSVDLLVETVDFGKDTLVGYADAVEVECGLQGSERAKENAVQLVREFLNAMGALADTDEPEEEALPVYRLRRLIPKKPAESYAVHVPNFERVDKGAPYATIDDEDLIAEEAFYPVLMSSYGYDDQFGYAAELTGDL
jgi:predicted deacylase